MYEPKFKGGDVITPDKSVVQTYHRIQVNDSIIVIDEVERINDTFYYNLNGSFSLGYKSYQKPLFPAVDIDITYKLDKIYLRKQKIDKLIYKNKNQVNEAVK